MTAPIKPKVREDLAIVELDGEAVIYDEANESLHHLNPTATLIFSLCDGTGTVRECSTDIAEAYGLDPAEVEREVRGLLREFRKSSLLNGIHSDDAGKRRS